MILHTTVLEESGYNSAMLGLSLNKEQPAENMHAVALKLCQAKEGSHRKFLRQIVVWLDVVAPRFWWTEFDTYKTFIVRNSGSTMHNIHKRNFEQADFDTELPFELLALLQQEWRDFKNGHSSIEQLKSILPEGYLQRSVVSLNYENLRAIIQDRKHHRLPHWRVFINQIMRKIEHPEFISHLID